MIETLLQSETFPYALAVLQSRVRGIQRHAFVLTDQEPDVLNRVKNILETTLETPIYIGRVDYRQEITKTKYRLVSWNKFLMDFIEQQTRNNKIVPRFVRDSKGQRRNYIRGFLERGSVTFSPHKVKRFDDYEIRYPRVIVTKSNGEDLLRSFAHLLRTENIIPTVSDGVLRIQRQQDIGRILKKRLMGEERLECLEGLSESLREYQEVA